MGDRRRKRWGSVCGLGVVTLMLAACGAIDEPASDAPGAEAGSPADRVDTNAAPADAGATPEPERATEVVTEVVPEVATEVATEVVTEVVPVPSRQDLDQPAIWPAPDVVFATPEEAAADFVSSVLISEGDPALGDFQQGDARSGEIPVLFAGETGDLDPPQQVGLLQLRRIGPSDGWFVISATSDGATIDAPAALEEVAAGTVTVSGEGRGFESTLVVSAFPPGDAAATFDLQIGAGGAFADLEPYSVELDLSAAEAGDVVVILVHGDTGLGSDPSTFAAIPVVIAPAPSVTIPATR